MSVVLVVNSGSSSFKYQLIEMTGEAVLASGVVERIGQPGSRLAHRSGEGERVRELPIVDHSAGFALMLAELGPAAGHTISVVGHRVVHGGTRFIEPTILTDEVEQQIAELAILAPLHNPGAVQGIRAARRAFPEVPHVAVFDTAFHQTLPPAAYTYAINRELAAAHHVRRYGFHGTSYRFVTAAAAAFLGTTPESVNLIVLHLGNGASAAAIRGGISVETSMGMTPLEGLVMGSRPGDIDPGVLLALHNSAGLSFDDLDTLLNRDSGMLGLTGMTDMRDIVAAALDGDAAAGLALDVYAHRVRGYIGGYLAQLGHADALVFTAGVGENSVEVRRRILNGLEALGLRLDTARNELRSGQAREISVEGSPIRVLVVPTNEELEIARQSIAAASG